MFNKLTLFLFISILSFSFVIAGSLSGKVNFDGKGPKKKTLKMDADPVCGSSHSGAVYSENFKMAEDGSMAEALVYLRDVSYSGGIPSEPAVLDQKGCIYTPHVLAWLLVKTFSLRIVMLHSIIFTLCLK